jgi:hypothetical protein
MTQNAINSKNPVLQIVTSSTVDVVTCSTAIPADDTIPQQGTEGTEVLTATITPKYSDSILEIIFSSQISNDATQNNVQVALFQDSTSNAIAAHSFLPGTTGSQATVGLLRHIMTSGTTSSTTFKIKVGPDANTCYVNANSTGTRLMGGVSSTRLTIVEYR